MRVRRGNWGWGGGGVAVWWLVGGGGEVLEEEGASREETPNRSIASVKNPFERERGGRL